MKKAGHKMTDAVWVYSFEVSSITKCTEIEELWLPGAGGEDGGYGLTDTVWFYSHEVSSIIKCTEIEELWLPGAGG